MNLDEAIKTLEAHNQWRRDRSEVNPHEMQNPTELGIAIDVVLEAAKDYLEMLVGEE